MIAERTDCGSGESGLSVLSRRHAYTKILMSAWNGYSIASRQIHIHVPNCRHSLSEQLW